MALVIATMLGFAAAASTAKAQPPDTVTEGPAAEVELVADGLTAPVFMTEQDGRLYIADQPGEIRVVEDGELLDEPFLDLSERIVDLDESFDERGVLGIAFHPDYADNGRFYVYYSAELRDGAPGEWDHTAHVSEFTVTDDALVADPDSERIVLEVDQPQFNHNAGHIAFGPDDGHLYVPLGDGGGANDEGPGHPPEGNGQATDTLLGSILRIDVDGEEPYAVPGDNPFVGVDEVEDEIYAYGLRNPYALAFDQQTGDLYAADAGQDLYEAVYRIEAGENYGWPIREGSQCFDAQTPGDPPAECPEVGPLDEPLTHPVVEYERGPETGTVIVGGVAYRGSEVPAIEQGQIVLADWTSDMELAEPRGLVFVADADAPVSPEGPFPDLQEVTIENPPEGAPQGQLGRFILAVRQDDAGEIYLLTSQEPGPTGQTGEVFRLTSEEADEDEVPVVDDVIDELDDDDGMAWLWIAIGAVLLLAIIGGLVAWNRRRSAGA